MEHKHLDIEIATPAQKESIGQAVSCSAPGAFGYFQVLANHAPLISELGVGELTVEQSDASHHYAISGGFLEVANNRVLILLESAEKAEDIDVDRAERAKERASQRLSASEDNVDFIRAKAALTRAINRLKVAGRSATA